MKIRVLAAMVIFNLLLSACSPLRMPQQNTYAINNLEKAAVPHYGRSHNTLLVTMPTASPGYNSSNMIYMITPFELQSYAVNRWVAPPATMLMPLFVDALRRSHYFAAVVSPPFSGITTYRLNTNLQLLQQEFILPTSEVNLSVLATLVNSTTNQVVASKEFDIKVPSPANNPYSGVLAANQAASKLSAQLVRFVVANVRS